MRAKTQTGQTTAIAGMSVLFTSLGIMVAQSLMTGTLSVRDARLNSEHLQNVYNKRFPD